MENLAINFKCLPRRRNLYQIMTTKDEEESDNGHLRWWGEQQNMPSGQKTPFWSRQRYLYTSRDVTSGQTWIRKSLSAHTTVRYTSIHYLCHHPTLLSVFQWQRRRPHLAYCIVISTFERKTSNIRHKSPIRFATEIKYIAFSNDSQSR